MIDWGDAIFYVKSKEGVPLKRFAAATAAVSAKKIGEILEDISKAQFLAEEEEKKRKKKRSPEFDELIIQAIKEIHAKNYDHAISMIGKARAMEKDAVEPYYLAAEAYTNQGMFGEAKESLEKALEKDVMFAPAHYLLGAIHVEEGKREEAENSYRKAIYLEKEFPLAHFGIGNIYRESGRIKAALREYRNTLNILSKSRPYDILPYSGGFNVATLSSVCKNNIERLKTAE
jgi:tetratricopeptide (TPR) repeat protein